MISFYSSLQTAVKSGLITCASAYAVRRFSHEKMQGLNNYAPWICVVSFSHLIIESAKLLKMKMDIMTDEEIKLSKWKFVYKSVKKIEAIVTDIEDFMAYFIGAPQSKEWKTTAINSNSEWTLIRREILEQLTYEAMYFIPYIIGIRIIERLGISRSFSGKEYLALRLWAFMINVGVRHQDNAEKVEALNRKDRYFFKGDHVSVQFEY